MGHTAVRNSHPKKYGPGSRACRVCGNPHGLIRKYGLMCCRQCFRSNAKEIGFIKYPQDAVSIVAKALLCFNNATVYKNCDDQFRLTPGGVLNVSRNATDAFCSGPCKAETQLVLRCIDQILSNFQFYNGATIQAVNTTLILACGNGPRRGDFNVTANIGAPTVPANHGSRLRPSPMGFFVDSGTFDLWIIGLLTMVIIM
ncbi:hypothetical protein Taro_017347 [Colocasia esculenta]|uniref:DUF7731 domain-containing protein n=1 Tax=Colocasia esculenta TaxID=4460 RepID=A0A843UFZ3_COLES|nr:hypothetical protein [Colocasia esculenta]